MSKHLKILTSQYLDDYSSKLSIDWLAIFNALKSKKKYTTEGHDVFIEFGKRQIIP